MAWENLRSEIEAEFQEIQETVSEMVQRKTEAQILFHRAKWRQRYVKRPQKPEKTEAQKTEEKRAYYRKWYANNLEANRKKKREEARERYARNHPNKRSGWGRPRKDAA